MHLIDIAFPRAVAVAALALIATTLVNIGLLKRTITCASVSDLFAIMYACVCTYTITVFITIFILIFYLYRTVFVVFVFYVFTVGNLLLSEVLMGGMDGCLLSAPSFLLPLLPADCLLLLCFAAPGPALRLDLSFFPVWLVKEQLMPPATSSTIEKNEIS